MNNLPCSAQSAPACDACALESRLMCRYEQRDTLHFVMMALPFFVTAIAGVIVAGYGWYLLGWLAYAVLFLLGWEARVLCSHCPYWAEPSRVLHCHANYGVVKLWRYRPGPMSRSEGIQFAVGAIVLIAFPIVLLALGGQWLLVAIAAASAVSWGYLLHRNVCSRCVNFSCPMSAVSKDLVDAYLRQNPAMREAWKRSGYVLDEGRVSLAAGLSDHDSREEYVHGLDQRGGFGGGVAGVSLLLRAQRQPGGAGHGEWPGGL